MKKLIRNTIIETYCVKHCCQDTPKRAVHAEGGSVSINTKVKPEESRSTIGEGRGCNKFVPVLGGDGAKIAPPGDLFDQPPGEMN